ncbi:hypothetical protein BH10PLA2_BH10PLA2_11710 [soil metagenome]
MYCFDIPPKHTAGTFWFHAHRHGSTGLQLSSGMAGALIIDPGVAGGLDDIPEIKEVMKNGGERILVFQQLQYSLLPDKTGVVTEFDVYGTGTATNTLKANLINGEYAPVFEMKCGEIQRWRCVHGGIDSTLNLGIGKDNGQGDLDPNSLWKQHEIAVDGLPLACMTTQSHTILQPGYRSDLLIQAPDQEGDYLFASLKVSPTQSLRRVSQSVTPLARIRVKGNMNPMKLPNKDAIGKYSLKSIDEKELFNRQPVKFEFDADSLPFTINKTPFDRDHPGVCPRLGTAEEWSLYSTVGDHPFHVHVNPFEVVTKDVNGNITSRIWRDTIFFREGESPTFIRMRFEDYPGKTVLHCHNLKHEDQGMMMAVQIVGKAPPTRCDPQITGLRSLPQKAPAWALTDAGLRNHSLENLKGQNHLLVFNRGSACVHCRRQLDAISKHYSKFAQAKTSIIAISPESPQELETATKLYRSLNSSSFLLLSDEKGRVFRDYGCNNGNILHGTFLVDAAGQVVWQAVGDEPYMDIDEILNQCLKHSDNR